jgi:two-component system, NarL family, response regulator LiaR
MMPIRVALADDHKVVTHSLRLFLESFPDLLVCGVARSGEELLERLNEWRPDVAVVDLFMPGGWDGIETTRRLRERRPAPRVIALTASTDEPRMQAVLREGAAGYVRKDADPETLLAAIRAVAQGRSYVDPAAARGVVAPVEELTAREREVLRMVQLSNKEIATRIGVGEETVKTHVARLLEKLGAGSRAHAVTRALKRGLLSVDELD